jgi:hypothetical protein
METEKDRDLWKLAKKRVGFRRHLATYIIINAFFWVIWFVTDHQSEDAENGGIPWPIFPMIGWGIGVTFSFLNSYVYPKTDSIEKEYEKLKNR